jgi:2-polyprenyl-3-methyl-5-hydroxy-6-metoxy-1,4-benzoquinol methylase
MTTMGTDAGVAKKIKETEAETLSTFKEEIPSRYFSHLGDREYEEYTRKAEQVYRDHFKFPPKMFQGADLIDFGAGTGENTVYLANWGARCTLVEMNEDAQAISKEVFKRRTKNFADHRFVHSSIFDYAPNDGVLYDIVHCRGVLSHTAGKEQAFEKIASFVKPGGYLIFGDPNKAGGFQNMLQRFAVYRLARTPDEMCDVCEELYKEDIDRSVKAIPRTRRAIIFDRWVIQSQDDPSVSEVLGWLKRSGLKAYSVYPPVLMPILGDSIHHFDKGDPYAFENLLALPESVWMTQTISDREFVPAFDGSAADFANSLTAISTYVANLQKRSEIQSEKFKELSRTFIDTARNFNPLRPINDKLVTFMKEAAEWMALAEEGDIKKLRKFIEGTTHLFKGACGVRHIDFVAYKPGH